MAAGRRPSQELADMDSELGLDDFIKNNPLFGHPLGDELQRLFLQGPGSPADDPRRAGAWGPDPSRTPSRPRLGSDGREELTTLNWQPREAPTPRPPAPTTPRDPPPHAGPQGGPDPVLDQLRRLANEIGVQETISYLQYITRLNGRDAVPSPPMSPHVFPSSPAAPGAPLVGRPLSGGCPPPPEGAPCWPPAAPRWSLPADPDQPAARPSRWVSAGLPPLLPLSPDDAFFSDLLSPPCLSPLPSPAVSDLGSSFCLAPPTSLMATPTALQATPTNAFCRRDDQTTTKEVLLDILRRSNSRTGGMSRGARHDVVCVFCRNNGESKPIYTSHRLKDPAGVIQCPVLRIYTCPTCGATGDTAHTLKYCPKAKDTASRVPLCSPRKSNGKIRVPLPPLHD